MSLYDHLSPWYNLVAEASESKLRKLGLELLAVRPGEWVLEVGSGTGCGLSMLARSAGSQGLVCGVDLSAGMLRQAQKHLASRQGPGIVRLIRADGLDLPFGNNQFDAGFMSFTLETLEETDRASLLQGLHRVVRPGGRLVVVCLSEGKGGMMERGYRWAHRHFPRWIDCRPIPVMEELASSGWLVMEARKTQMWGIPVSVALARKAENHEGSISRRNPQGSTSPEAMVARYVRQKSSSRDT